MVMKRWDGAAHVDLTVAKRWDGAAHVDLTLAKRWDGAAWVDIPLPGGGGGGLSATASPGRAIGEVTDTNLFVTVTSNSVTVTPSGGTAPYTYAWTRLSGDSAVAANSPTTATTTFSANVPKWDSREATMQCTVTDSLSATTTVNVLVTLTHNGTGIPP
jgi:hypothetical protein